LTITRKLQLVLLPQESLAVVVTRFVPIGKKLPLGGMEERVSGELQPPEAEVEKNTVVPLTLVPVGVTVRSEEHVSTIGGEEGGFTVTVKLQWAVSPQASPAALDTVVVPMGKRLPLGGVLVTDPAPQVPPLAVTEKNTSAPLPLVAVTTIFDGQLMPNGTPAACERAGVNKSRQAASANKILLVFMAKFHLMMFLIDMLHP
jgi:hypothetical protein